MKSERVGRFRKLACNEFQTVGAMKLKERLPTDLRLRLGIFKSFSFDPAVKTNIVINYISKSCSEQWGQSKMYLVLKEFCVRITFSYNNPHDMTNSIVEISKAATVGVTLLTRVSLFVQVEWLHMLPSHPILDEPPNLG